MRRIGLTVVLILSLSLVPLAVEAQQSGKVYRVGVIHQGGSYGAVIQGLREGLGELGFEERKHFVLDVRNTKGNLRDVEEAARDLVRARVDLLYTVPTSVSLAAKRATEDVPIVFCAGTDPVGLGLVESLAKPGGRLTGIHFLSTDLTAKRLEVLKELLPKARRIVTFYDPANPSARESSGLAREAARHLGIELIERRVSSVDELLAGLRALRPGEADAFLPVSDAMVLSQTPVLIEIMKPKRLPMMIADLNLVAAGALAGYGVNYHEVGRQSAKHVRRVLSGTSPKDLPVESVDRVQLVLNRHVAVELGLTIPQSVLGRADQVIE
jgi:putative tryptophan/tyrosine transport system substrate-binding protein